MTPWDTGLEFLPVGGWLGMALCVLAWRWMRDSDLSFSAWPLPLEIVATVAALVLLVALFVAFCASALAMLASGIGWISAGFVWIGLAMGFGRATLAYWTFKSIEIREHGFFQTETWLLFGQLAVLSIVSVAALLVAGRELRR